MLLVAQRPSTTRSLGTSKGGALQVLFFSEWPGNQAENQVVSTLFGLELASEKSYGDVRHTVGKLVMRSTILDGQIDFSSLPGSVYDQNTDFQKKKKMIFFIKIRFFSNLRHK